MSRDGILSLLRAAVGHQTLRTVETDDASALQPSAGEAAWRRHVSASAVESRVSQHAVSVAAASVDAVDVDLTELAEQDAEPAQKEQGQIVVPLGPSQHQQQVQPPSQEQARSPSLSQPASSVPVAAAAEPLSAASMQGGTSAVAGPPKPSAPVLDLAPLVAAHAGGSELPQPPDTTREPRAVAPVPAQPPVHPVHTASAASSTAEPSPRQAPDHVTAPLSPSPMTGGPDSRSPVIASVAQTLLLAEAAVAKSVGPAPASRAPAVADSDARGTGHCV